MSEVVIDGSQRHDRRSWKLYWCSYLFWSAAVMAISFYPNWVFVAVIVPAVVVVQVGMFLYAENLTPREVCQNNPTFWEKFWLAILVLLMIVSGVLMFVTLMPDRK